MVDLKHQIPINASPAKVYDAIATQRGMQGWWTADTKMEGKVGGKAEFGFVKRAMVFRMKIEKMEPDKSIVMKCSGDHPEWDGTTLTFTITRDGDISILRFTHSGWKSVTDYYASCNSMWGNLMFRLKDLVEGQSRGPQWTE